MAQQELGEALLRRDDLVAGVGEGAGQVAGGLALLVGHVHLVNLVYGELLCEELGVPPVFTLLSAAGLSIFDTAPMTQSTPGARSSRQRWKPVTPDSQTTLGAPKERTQSATAAGS